MRTVFIALALALTALGQQFTWEGDVAGIAVLRIHGRKVDIELRDGPPAANVRFRFAAGLPESRQTVSLRVREGRGAVNIIEQPNIDNGYSAGVLIEDRQDGAGHYSIALSWDSRAGAPPGRVDRLKWSGTVDGEAVVECRGAQCTVKLSRGGASAGKYRFSRPLPAFEVLTMLEETGGPADIRILEQPSQANGYTVRVSIRSLRETAPCSFVLGWERVRW